MAREVNQVLWDQWRQRIKRQRESGLSIAEFCRRENISSHGFYVWRRNLRQAASTSAMNRVRTRGCNVPDGEVPWSRRAADFAMLSSGPRCRHARRTSCNCRSRPRNRRHGSSWRWPTARSFACPSRISRR